MLCLARAYSWLVAVAAWCWVTAWHRCLVAGHVDCLVIFDGQRFAIASVSADDKQHRQQFAYTRQRFCGGF